MKFFDHQVVGTLLCGHSFCLHHYYLYISSISIWAQPQTITIPPQEPVKILDVCMMSWLYSTFFVLNCMIRRSNMTFLYHLFEIIKGLTHPPSALIEYTFRLNPLRCIGIRISTHLNGLLISFNSTNPASFLRHFIFNLKYKKQLLRWISYHKLIDILSY